MMIAEFILWAGVCVVVGCAIGWLHSEGLSVWSYDERDRRRKEIKDRLEQKELDEITRKARGG